jgi:FKBP-type peptidyl-prolyl cis-trans isomerase 2
MNMRTEGRRVMCLFLVLTLPLSVSVFAEPSKENTTTTISNGQTISIEYTLTLENEKVIDTNVGKKPLKFVQGSHEIIPGLEIALEGMKKGESKHVTVPPEQGYGPKDPKAILEVPIDQISPDARKVGTQLQGKDAQGRVVHPRVVEVKEQEVVLDFNHPLAGETLYFDVKILDVESSSTP